MPASHWSVLICNCLKLVIYTSMTTFVCRASLLYYTFIRAVVMNPLDVFLVLEKCWICTLT